MVYLLGRFLFYNFKGSDIILMAIAVIIALFISSGLILVPGILVQTKNSIYMTQKASLILKHIAYIFILMLQIFLFF